MPVTYPANVKAARMTAVQGLVDAGSTFGRLEIGTAGMAVILATLTLPKPSGAVSGAVLTLSGFPLSDTDAEATGVAAAARVVDSDGNLVISGLTVGSSSGDVRIAALNIQQHQTVTIDSAVFTHAA